MDTEEVQTIILRLLRVNPALPITYFIFDDARGICGLVKSKLGIELPTTEWVVFSQAFWELIARRLIFVGGDRTFSNCRVLLTERGQRAADGEEFNPDDPARYMERLLAAVPGTSDTTKQYLKETLKSYEQECFWPVL